MGLQTTRGSRESLRRLPTPGRSVVDPSDIVVPEGYRVEPVLVGLSFPTGMGFADDGTLFVLEGGSTWPTRPYLPARILKLDPSGELETVGVEVLGGPRGIAWRDGAIYVSVKGGHHTHIDRINLETGERSIVVDGLPNGGWHEPGGPIFGSDGLMYFAQGSVSQNGVALPQGFTVDLAKHPAAADVPGQDITLTGNNIQSYDPRAAYPYYVETGAFKPFGTPAAEGEIIKGEMKCSTGVWRANPDGSEMELIAWGIRNPYGMVFGEDGELYISDNDFEETGDRAVAEDPDRIWRIGSARTPHGSVEAPDWYGFPDICGDGLPVWHEDHLPRRGKAAEQLIADPPPWAGPAVYLEKPHSCMTKMDVSRSDAFSHRGELFVCEWGTMAPMNTPRPEALERGFKVIRVDVASGEGQDFMRNSEPGPASALGSGGIERPVDCKFHPDGESLYVLDFGVARVRKGYMMAFGHTGVLWRITRER